MIHTVEARVTFESLSCSRFQKKLLDILAALDGGLVPCGNVSVRTLYFTYQALQHSIKWPDQ